MVGKYDIYYGDHVVGQADMRLEGLYYCISCRCVLADADLYKIEMRYASQSYILGTLIPNGRIFALERKVSKKQFTHEKPAFYIMKKCEEIFVPICDDKPFAYLEALRSARFEFRNGQPGILLKKDGNVLNHKISNSKPTGQ